jgi:flagellar motility protein MotE (MotC chaperone)
MTPKGVLLAIGISLAFSGVINSKALTAYGQEDPVKIIEQKRQELAEREGRLKKEEERVRVVQKEVEARIQKLNQLLSQIEEGLKKLEAFRTERLGHLVKTFEAMPPEEAAVRLASVERTLAVQIVFKMNSKKAGAVLALMDPKKVAELTEGISKNEKKIPIK